jgi:hypothetical protein
MRPELGPALREAARSRRLRRRLPYDLGILLVHGVGEQQRGDTLTEAGDQILEWLARRAQATGSDADVELNLMDVVDRQASTDDIASAHAVIRVTPPVKGRKPGYWVMAESFWGDVFRPATFSELASWGIFIGPWAFAAQARGIFLRMETAAELPTWLRPALLAIIWAVAGVMFIVGAFVGLAVTVLALALVVLALTNLPFLADFARTAQRTLANGVGDAYVLSRSPIRFGAMSSQVGADLEALAKVSRAVVVIAHSQGTAVAWHAIKHGLTDRPSKRTAMARHLKLFLTYGQAVRKLTFMKMAAEDSQARNGILAFVGAGSGLLALIEFFLAAPWALRVITVALALLAEGILMWRVRPVWKQSQVKIEWDWDKVHAVAPGIEWLDLWASADPVPGGPLELDRPPAIRTIKIRNLASGILDHVVYWQNGTEFLAVVATRLFQLGAPRDYPADLADPVLLVSAMRRHARVLLLMAMRVVLVGAAAALALQAWWTPGFSTGLMMFLGHLNLPLVDTFLDKPPAWTKSLAGVIVVLVAAVIAWAPFATAWSSLASADLDTYFLAIMKKPLWDWRWWTLASFFALTAIGAAVLLVKLGAPALALGYAVATGFAMLLALTVLSSGGKTLVDAETPEPSMTAASRITGEKRTGAITVSAAAAILLAVPVAVGWFWHAALGPTLVVEGLVLSSVLLLEGVREYRAFESKFNTKNGTGDGAAGGTESAGGA